MATLNGEQTDISEFLSDNWPWLVAGGLVLAVLSIRRQPARATSEQWQRQDYRLQLAPKAAGTYQTLAIMAQIVRRDSGSQYVRSLAEEITRRCPGHGFECEVRAIFEYCRDRIIYRRDPVDVERVQDTRRAIESGYGDCDDKVVALCSLLGSLGHKTRFGLLSNRMDDFSHVYAQVYVRNRGWLDLDPTPERGVMGWRGRALRYGHYEIWPSQR